MCGGGWWIGKEEVFGLFFLGGERWGFVMFIYGFGGDRDWVLGI